MTFILDMTKSLLLIIEQNRTMILNLAVLIIVLAAMTHFLSAKNFQEKNEAIKEVIIFGSILILLYFVLTVVATLGQSAGKPSSVAEILGLCALAYWVLYSTKLSSKKQGKPVFYTKAYRELREIETWLDEKGQQGFLSTAASPDIFYFNLLKTEIPYQYKVAYYPSSKLKDMRAFVEKNELDGWDFVNPSIANPNLKDPKKSIGSSMIAVFKTDDMTLSKGSASRFDYVNLTRKLGSTIIGNIVILIVAIAATWYFKDVPFLLNSTVVIGFAACIQMFLYFYLRYATVTDNPATKNKKVN